MCPNTKTLFRRNRSCVLNRHKYRYEYEALLFLFFASTVHTRIVMFDARKKNCARVTFLLLDVKFVQTKQNKTKNKNPLAETDYELE